MRSPHVFAAIVLCALFALAAVLTWAFMDIGMPVHWRRGITLAFVLTILLIIGVLAEK